MSIFVNYTNHPSSFWAAEQINEAEKLGKVVDIPFPVVPPQATEREIQDMVTEQVEKIIALTPVAVLCQGEFSLCYGIVSRLKKHGIKVLAACSCRQVMESIDDISGNGQKVTSFKFVRFREYTE